jgi:RNA polymerase subunit RPABC4/transcription elongation factor Spt4
MKFCFNCGRITPGDPLFCNYCARSYDIKLCPRMHPNPRRAEVCSRCGSRDFSTPQPVRPVWAPALEFLLSAIPGVLLVVGSVSLILFFVVQVLSSPGAFLSFLLLGSALAILWSMWSQIPAWFRRAIYSPLKRIRGDGGRGGDR